MSNEQNLEKLVNDVKVHQNPDPSPLSFQFPFNLFHFLSFVFSHFFRIDSKHKKHHEPEHHVIMNAW